MLSLVESYHLTYLALAIITDHLLKFLTFKKFEFPPSFSYEKFNINIEELEPNFP